MSSAARSGLIAAVMLAVAVGGFLAGVKLADRASQPGTETLTLERPSAAAPRDVALRSPAGFTGFEEGSLGGEVTRSGETVAAEDASFAVVGGGARLDVRLSAPARLFRIVPGSEPLAAGDVVVIRLAADGAAEAVLRVPSDLREGDSR